MAKKDTERGSRVTNDSRRRPLATDEQRAPREQADAGRTTDGLELTQDEREQMLRDDALQNQLPNPPRRPGVHWFWASLTNQYTSVTWYMRLGFRPVKFEEMEGWAEANMRGKSGDYAGCVTVNEMLLMRVDETSYQRYMKIVHHDKPMQEQHRMRDSMRSVQEAVAQESGQDLVRDATAPGESSGMQSLDRTAKRPARFEGDGEAKE